MLHLQLFLLLTTSKLVQPRVFFVPLRAPYAPQLGEWSPLSFHEKTPESTQSCTPHTTPLDSRNLLLSGRL